MKYYRTSLLFILFIVISYSVNGQGQINFKVGQIVTLENDTLHGLIYNSGDLRKTRLCIYKADKKSKAIKYGPNDIKSYRITDGKYYVSKLIPHNHQSKQRFIEVLMEGDVNLYHFNGSYPIYLLQREGSHLLGLNNEERNEKYLTHNYPLNWEGYIFGSNEYKDSLYNFFIDCVPILNELPDVEYTRNSIFNTTKKYLELTCDQDNCISYESDSRGNKGYFGVFTGIQFSKILFYSYLVDSEITASIPVGVFYNIPLSLFSERLSFQAELIASRVNYKKPFINNTSDWDDISIRSTVIGIPLLLNFEFPLKNITPSIGIGKETAFVVGSKATYKTQRFNESGVIEYGDVDFLLHKFQKEGWFADVGVNFKIHPKFSLYSSLRFQRHLNLIIEDENYNNSTFDIAETFVYSTKYYTYSGTLRVGLRF